MFYVYYVCVCVCLFVETSPDSNENSLIFEPTKLISIYKFWIIFVQLKIKSEKLLNREWIENLLRYLGKAEIKIKMSKT